MSRARKARVPFDGGFVGVVVEEDEVEVGRVAQLLAAELAETDDRELGRRGRARGAVVHLHPRLGERRREDDVRQRGQVVGEALDGQRAGQVLREQAKRLRVLEMAQHVHLPFGVAVGGGLHARELARATRPSRARPGARADRAARRAGSGVASGSRPPTARRPSIARGAAASSDARSGARDRRCAGSPSRGARTADGTPPAHRRRRWPPPRRPRAIAARARRRAAATAPAAADTAARRERARDARGGRRDRRSRPRAERRLAPVRRRRHLPRPPRATASWRPFAAASIAARLDIAAVASRSSRRRGRRTARRQRRDAQRASRSKSAIEAAPIARASASRSAGSAGSICVCRSSRYCSRCSRLRRKTYASRSAAIAAAGSRPRSAIAPRAQASVPRAAQAGLAPAAHELQRLHDELDLANAAGPELDVLRVVVALALLGDLAMDVAQSVISVVVQVLAKDERRHQRVELVVPLAGQRAGLEPRVALPRAPLRDEVLLERRVRARPADRSRRRAEAACRRGRRSPPA